MRQFILLLILLVCLTGCFSSAEEKLKTDVAEYYKIQELKRNLSQQYSELMQDPEENSNQIRQMDKQLHQLNLKLKEIVSNPEVRSYLQKERQRDFEYRKERSSSANNNLTPATKRKKEKDFEYYTDNTTIEGDINFVDDDFKDDLGGNNFSDDSNDSNQVDIQKNNKDNESGLDLNFSDIDTGMFEEAEINSKESSEQDLIEDDLGSDMNFEYDSNDK